MNKVYIVLVNYNNYEDTIECLESILKSNYPDFQIFVIDNSSTNTSIDCLTDWVTNNDYCGITTVFDNLVFPLIEKPLSYLVINESNFNRTTKYIEKIVIVRAANRGFAAANNIALTYILETDGASFIWILNNDTVIERDTLSKLVEFYKGSENKRIVLSSKLRYYTLPDTIQAVAGRYNTWLGKHYHIGNGEKDLGQHDHYLPGKTDYVVGASMFLPKLFLEQTGLMSEDYFLYFEELDWIQTGKKYGYTISLVPDAIVYHKEGASIIKIQQGKKDTFVAEYYSIVNRVKFIRKWYPYRLTTVVPIVIFALLKRLLTGKFKLVKKATIGILKILFTDSLSLHDH